MEGVFLVNATGFKLGGIDGVIPDAYFELDPYPLDTGPGSPGQQPPVVAPNNFTKAQNLSVLDPNYKWKKALYKFCGDSAGGRFLKSVRKGAIAGAGEGAFFGGVAGELSFGEFTLGMSGVGGAYAGAHAGAAVGAMNGLTWGSLSAGACAALGAY
jgi:hypothetical protein